MPTRQARTASAADCRAILEELRARSSDYSAVFRECAKGRALDTIASAIRQRVDPARPYFFGQLASGIRFAGDARDFPAMLHALYPDCNSTLIKALITEIGDSDGDVVDAGANLGVVSASLARHMAGRGHVHAFEPSPETFRLAAATIALNDLHNVTLTEAALSDEDGDIRFHTTPGNSAIAASYRHEFPFLNEWAEIVVPSRRLDSVLQGRVHKLALIKIDVEGNEMKVMRGARDLIRRLAPKVVYEYTPVAASGHGWTDGDTISLLEEIMPFRFEALVEPPLHAMASAGRWVSFPLPQGVHDQVNVFARPRVGVAAAELT